MEHSIEIIRIIRAIAAELVRNPGFNSARIQKIFKELDRLEKKVNKEISLSQRR